MTTYTLYIKTHKETGLKYFGVTTNSDPHKYRGSGVYWKKHIKAHGYNVTTEVFHQTEDLAEASVIATVFSIQENIIESNLWANLILEHCLDGKPVGSPGHIFTDEELHRMADIQKQLWATPEHMSKMKLIRKDQWTPEAKAKLSSTLRELYSNGRPEHSAAMKDKWSDPDYYAANVNHIRQAGKNKSPEHIAKITAKIKGKPKSEEHRKKLSEAAKRRKRK